MQISIGDQSGPTARVVLVGKRDMIGAMAMAAPLASLAESKQAVLVDMSDVTFLCPTGIRQFISATDALARRGGSLVLLNPTELVEDVLTTVGVNSLMSIVHSEAEAEAALKPHMGGDRIRSTPVGHDACAVRVQIELPDRVGLGRC